MSITTDRAPAPLGADAPAGAAHRSHAPVVLATDGRAPTDATAVAARLVAERLGAPVHVVAVLEPAPIYAVGEGLPVLPPGVEAARMDELRASVLRRLEPVLGPPAAAAPGGWRLDVLYGPRGRVIADVARERRAAMVVVGAGPHRALDRLFGEELSLQLVRHAGAPVLAVGPALERLPRRAVVGMDFSAASIRAARTALALLASGPAGAAGGGGELLTLVHVRSALEAQQPALLAWASEYDAGVAERFERLRALLRADVPAAAAVPIEMRVRTGGVVDCLADVAGATGAELVAVGTQGPGWMERLFVGSVAQSALRHASRTVLVTPAPSPAERVRLELRVAGQVELERPEDWGGALDALTRRDAGRLARLEVSGPSLGPRAGGAAVESEGYRFVGATWDPHDRRVEIMLGEDPARVRRLTHGIPAVRSIEIVTDAAGRDHALLVEDATGESVLTFV